MKGSVDILYVRYYRLSERFARQVYREPTNYLEVIVRHVRSSL